MRALPWLFLAGCAPAYRPPAPFVPMLGETGDGNLAAQLGVGGGQVDGAYALTEGFALRGGAQVAGYAGEGSYLVGRLGASAYGTNGANGRWALVAEVGGGHTDGITEVQFTTRTTSGSAPNRQTQTFRNTGALGVAALRSEFGAEFEHGAVGVQLGVTGALLSPGAASDSRRTGLGSTFELAGVGRAGSPQVQFQGHFGIAWPLASSDNMGLAVPLLLGAGFVFDLPKHPPPTP